jgi:hypothetical protein
MLAWLKISNIPTLWVLKQRDVQVSYELHGNKIQKYEVNFVLLITCSVNEWKKLLLCSSWTQRLEVRMRACYVRDHKASMRVMVMRAHSINGNDQLLKSHRHRKPSKFLARSQNCEKRLLVASCLSVRASLHETRLPLDRFNEIWYLRIFRKTVEKIQV